MFYFPLDKAAR